MFSRSEWDDDRIGCADAATCSKTDESEIIMIKNEYADHFDEETQGKLAISGALRLYLDFINLFIMLLHLFGNRE